MPDRIDPQSLNPKHVEAAIVAEYRARTSQRPPEEGTMAVAIAAYLNAVREDDEAMGRAWRAFVRADLGHPSPSGRHAHWMRDAFTAAVTVPPCERCGGTREVAAGGTLLAVPCPVCGVREEADRKPRVRCANCGHSTDHMASGGCITKRCGCRRWVREEADRAR